MANELTATAFDAEEGLDDWRYLLGRIEARYRGATPTEASSFAGLAVEAGEEAGRLPDLDLRPPVVHLALGTGGLLPADLTLARRLSTLAAERGLVAEPLAAVRSEIAIDAVDIDAVRPFWKAALAYDDEPTPEGQQVIALVDPLRIGPPVWFQQMDAVRPERNHIHIDVTVPHDVAEERVAAVLAAGGTLRYSAERSFHVLADVEGNELCICTWLDRD
jgi:4a-hydroxytetrahydrobiopterin dehydratase